jgi:hypothetical protein
LRERRVALRIGRGGDLQDKGRHGSALPVQVVRAGLGTVEQVRDAGADALPRGGHPLVEHAVAQFVRAAGRCVDDRGAAFEFVGACRHKDGSHGFSSKRFKR